MLEEALPGTGRVDEAYRVRLPAGYLLDDRTPRIRGVLAAGVREVRVVVPLWREAVLDLAVLDADGRPVRDARMFLAAGQSGCPKRLPVEEGTAGRLLVHGIAHRPGSPVALRLVDPPRTKPGRDGGGAEVTVLPASAFVPDVGMRVPADPNEPWRLDLPLNTPLRPRTIFSETDNDRPYEEALDGEVPRARPPATAREPARARVQVLGWDGTPVAAAHVRAGAARFGGRHAAGVTDRRGTVLLRGLPAGHAWIRSWAPGHVPCEAESHLQAGRTTQVVLREPRGARLEVRVTDADGRPRPSARLRVEGAAVFDVEDGVQRLDPFTDARGLRSLARVAPGKATVVAIWGGLRAEQALELRDGETTRVHLVPK